MISIVTAYHNRKDLFLNTLKTIDKFKGNNEIEVIAVDDCSSEEHRIEDLVDIFPFLKVIRIEKENKWYINPCVVFNIGFKEVKGDVIIIQNPECLHVGDVISEASKINENEYLSFGCYSMDRNKTEVIKNYLMGDFELDLLLNNIEPNHRPVTSDGENGWYNHSMLRPVGYHFCSAISKKNLHDLGGFDERFANGIAYDDNEILIRIQKKGLNIKIVNQPFVAHQWHYSSHNYQHLNVNELINKNRGLLEIIRREPNWQSNR
jgi:GT2 family glycosyltransferase